MSYAISVYEDDFELVAEISEPERWGGMFWDGPPWVLSSDEQDLWGPPRDDEVEAFEGLTHIVCYQIVQAELRSNPSA